MEHSCLPSRPGPAGSLCPALAVVARVVLFAGNPHAAPAHVPLTSHPQPKAPSGTQNRHLLGILGLLHHHGRGSLGEAAQQGLELGLQESQGRAVPLSQASWPRAPPLQSSQLQPCLPEAWAPPQLCRPRPGALHPVSSPPCPGLSSHQLEKNPASPSEAQLQRQTEEAPTPPCGDTGSQEGALQPVCHPSPPWRHWLWVKRYPRINANKDSCSLGTDHREARGLPHGHLPRGFFHQQLFLLLRVGVARSLRHRPSVWADFGCACVRPLSASLGGRRAGAPTPSRVSLPPSACRLRFGTYWGLGWGVVF